MKLILAGMKKWSCETGVNWKLGQITTSTTNPPYFRDDINTIYYVNSLPSGGNMGTYKTECPNFGFQKSFDIEIDENIIFNYSISGSINPGDRDFYSTILHELGHGQSLNHVRNTTDLMYATSAQGPRKINLLPNDKNGGLDILGRSITFNPNNQCSSKTMTAANKTAIGCYSFPSQKMQLEGISISCKCAPGKTSNGAKPILQPRITGGVEPYYYFWEPLTGNTATIDNVYLKEPTVIGPINTSSKVKYKLTVIDNAAEPTITSRIVEVDLTTTQTVNYAMRDSYEDVYDEPNNQIHWDIWNSPDIWTRNSAGTSNTEHENPEYRANTDNYVNFRIRNIGCTTNSNIGQAVRLYWTMSSAMEDWDQDWKNAVAGGLDVGDEITENTPNGIILPQDILPGSERLYSFPWRVKNPRAYPDFDPFLKKIDVCLLARMESGAGAAPYNTPPQGMTFLKLKDQPTFQN